MVFVLVLGKVEDDSDIVAERDETDSRLDGGDVEQRDEVADKLKLALEVGRPDTVRGVQGEVDVGWLPTAVWNGKTGYQGRCS